MKILYAAGNNQSSKTQLLRFYNSINHTNHQLKIAAYKKSSPLINIDWCLDSLLNIFKPETLSLDNENVQIYFEWVKSYKPDIIISDLEYFTSYISNLENIPLWQASSSLINFALTHQSKYNVGMFKMYYHLFNRDPFVNQRIFNIIDNSDQNFVYSHFGDLLNSPDLKTNFKWVRPYHKVGKSYKPCEHNVIAKLSNNNKRLINIINQYTDSIVFSEFTNEKYKNITIKSSDDLAEYYCNIFNSKSFVCEGQASDLADAYYNQQHSWVAIDFNDTECVINGLMSEHLGLSSSLKESSDLLSYTNKIIPNYKEDIKYLHEYIEDL